ncbi:unnamed protein product, partial [Ilex paraguariensis]
WVTWLTMDCTKPDTLLEWCPALYYDYIALLKIALTFIQSGLPLSQAILICQSYFGPLFLYSKPDDFVQLGMCAASGDGAS